MTAEHAARPGGSWWRPEQGRHLVQGLPALLAGLGVLVAACLILLTPEEDLAARYRAEVVRSARAGDYPQARKCYERLLILVRDRVDGWHELAVTREILGEEAWAKAQPGPPATPGHVGESGRK